MDYGRGASHGCDTNRYRSYSSVVLEMWLAPFVRGGWHLLRDMQEWFAAALAGDFESDGWIGRVGFKTPLRACLDKTGKLLLTCGASRSAPLPAGSTEQSIRQLSVAPHLFGAVSFLPEKSGS